MLFTISVQRSFQRFVILLAAAALGACGKALDEQALREFKSAHSDAIVQEQFVGEGDFDHAYMHFRYTTPASPERVEQMWLYQWQKDKTWRVIAKVGPKPPGSDFGD